MASDTIEAAAPSSNQLRKGALGVGAITFFVISAAGPLVAIAGGVPVGMLLGNGPGIPGTYVITVILLLIFAIGYCTLARHVTNAGAFYAFAARGLGGTAGGGAAMIALVGYNAMQIGLYGMFGAACSGLFQSELGISLPWWLYAAVALASIAVLGYRQIDLSAKILSVLVGCEYVAVLILDIAITRHGGNGGLSAEPFTPHAMFSMSPSIGLLFCFASFVGFEATTIYGEEAKDPKRTIPRATYASVLLVGIFYTFSSWCMVNGAGAGKLVKLLTGLQDPTQFLFILSNQYVGHGLTAIMRILFVTSVYAGLLAFHNSVARYFFATGREGLLPAFFGRTHKSHQSPHVGSAAQTILAAIVVTIFAVSHADPVLTLFSWLTNVATLGVIALMAIASFAVPGFFARNPDAAEGRWTTTIAPCIAGILLTIILALAIVHFDVLTGASKALSWSLPGLIVLGTIAGIVLATRLRARDPARFAQLGHKKV